MGFSFASVEAINFPHDPVGPLNRSGYHRFSSRAGAIVEQVISGLEMTGNQNARDDSQHAFPPFVHGGGIVAYSLFVRYRELPVLRAPRRVRITPNTKRSTTLRPTTPSVPSARTRCTARCLLRSSRNLRLLRPRFSSDAPRGSLPPLHSSGLARGTWGHLSVIAVFNN